MTDVMPWAPTGRWPRYVEAPHYCDSADCCDSAGPSLYLAGGITDCPDWQADAVDLLDGEQMVVFNPRRRSFCVADSSAAADQVRWEHDHLKRADVVMFWFSEGPSPQPIALYELGAMAASGKQIVVGVHRDYLRRTDVRLQLDLARPGLEVHTNLATTTEAAVARLPDRSAVATSGPCRTSDRVAAPAELPMVAAGKVPQRRELW